MAERKVLNKYYPPDYDPSKVPRIKKKNKQNDVRIMAPFNMKCNTCGNYIANATKFNAKKETIEDQTYNNLMIFRFYIKCPRCMATIIFRTNPKEQGYEVEHGATENFMALKLAERRAREEAEAEEEEEKINPMKHLENRTKASKQQMEASDQLQSLRMMKHRHNKVDIDSIIQSKRKESLEDESKVHIKDEEEEKIKNEAIKMMKRKAIEMEHLGPSVSKSEISISMKKPATSTKISSSLSNLKKKIKIVPKNSFPTDSSTNK